MGSLFWATLYMNHRLPENTFHITDSLKQEMSLNYRHNGGNCELKDNGGNRKG